MPRQQNSRALPLITAVLLAAMTMAACTGGASKSIPLSPDGGTFRIDASGIAAGEVRFFSYETSGRTVVFMVARTHGGELKTAFDACITCYPYKKGYICETGRVVCVQCGTVFELDELGVGKGNCVPIRIAHALDGDTVIIDRAVIEAGAKWF